MTVAVQKRWTQRRRRRETANAWHRSVGELLPENRATLGPYAGLKPAWAVEYFRRRFLRSLASRVNFGEILLADVGAGFGWLALAYATSGGRAAVAIDSNSHRLRILARLARILVPDSKVWAVVASAEHLPFKDAVFGVVATVETLEHVGEGFPKRQARLHQRQALQELRRTSSDWILLSTPNRWFPWVRHDVSLPLAHWLPHWLKRAYAGLFRRRNRCARVRLLSVPEVERTLGVSGPATPFLNFDSPAEWAEIFPYRTPYLPEPGQWVDRRGSLHAKIMTFLYRLLGARARYFYPSICGLYAVGARGRRES
ncbi:MAG: class I SAM-dependent methyltransferase [Calditrichaeota bacterium]|nr:class I SAM-dependent methyltransferase [Calditrichota bacterium]